MTETTGNSRGALWTVGATIVLVLALAMVFFMLRGAAQELDEVANQRYRSFLLADELRQSSDDLTRLGRTYTVTGNPAYEQQYNDILDIRNGKKARPQAYWRVYWDFVAAGESKPRPEDRAVALQELMKDAGFTEAEFGKLKEAQGRSDGLVNLEVEAMNAVKGLYKDERGEYKKKGEPDLELARRLVHSPEYHAAKAQIMKPVDEFFVILDERTQKAQSEAKSRLSALQTLFILLLLATLACFAATVWLGYRQIVVRLGGKPAELDALVGELAGGNLGVRIPDAPAGSGIARIGEMARQLRALVQGLDQAVVQVDDAARELTRNVDVSARAASDTSDSTASMAASMEEMSVGISHISETAKGGARIAEASGAQSERGGEVIERAATEIRAISDMIGDVSARIGELGQSSERITSVVQVIRDVADQTNLLALNAAIEAARAGETGRGFAVVADEVRKLAERTGSATGEIAAMISSIQASAHNAVEAMGLAVERVGSGVGYSEEAARAIAGIRDGARKSVEMSQEISNALAEQNTAGQSMAAQIERVANAADGSRHANDEAATSARKLEALAASLREMASRFKT